MGGGGDGSRARREMARNIPGPLNLIRVTNPVNRTRCPAVRALVRFDPTPAGFSVHSRTVSVLALYVLAACGARNPPEAGQAAAAQPPLAALVGQPLIVLPVRYLEAADTLGWGAQAGQPSEYLRELDRAIATALAERGVGSSWTLAERLVQNARRNPAVMPDPTLVPADQLRGRRITRNMVADPLASQLRALTAIAGARHALVPVELRFENAAGGVRPVLRLFLIDTRTAMIRASLDIAAEPISEFSPAVLSSIASRFADLFATR